MLSGRVHAGGGYPSIEDIAVGLKTKGKKKLLVLDNAKVLTSGAATVYDEEDECKTNDDISEPDRFQESSDFAGIVE